MNEELDSQVSAMFDDELPAAECELLARRLSRDEQLQVRWGRYALIGAAIRAEGALALDARLARRVRSAVSAEPAFTSHAPDASSRQLAARWWRPAAGLGVAASVAALSILWLRLHEVPGTGPEPLRAALNTSADPGHLVPAVDRSDSYVVPRSREHPSMVPATQFANYVVAHSEFSSPVNRRNLLSALMANESGTAAASSGSEEPSEDVNDDAKSAP
jgi:sigma-E factor negative regulatory protein RseA